VSRQSEQVNIFLVLGIFLVEADRVLRWLRRWGCNGIYVTNGNRSLIVTHVNV